MCEDGAYSPVSNIRKGCLIGLSLRRTWCGLFHRLGRVGVFRLESDECAWTRTLARNPITLTLYAGGQPREPRFGRRI